MEYWELRVYDGPLTSCNTCLKMFRQGDVITVADNGKLAFCHSDGDGGCLQEYLFFKMRPPRMLSGNPYVYQQHNAKPESAEPSAASPVKRHPWWHIWK